MEVPPQEEHKCWIELKFDRIESAESPGVQEKRSIADLGLQMLSQNCGRSTVIAH
jgi:hypothetical protein